MTTENNQVKITEKNQVKITEKNQVKITKTSLKVTQELIHRAGYNDFSKGGGKTVRDTVNFVEKIAPQQVSNAVSNTDQVVKVTKEGLTAGLGLVLSAPAAAALGSFAAPIAVVGAVGLTVWGVCELFKD